MYEGELLVDGMLMKNAMVKDISMTVTAWNIMSLFY